MDDLEEISFLKAELKRCQEDLSKSAHIGKQLLEQNNILSQRIENLEQNKYTIQQKLDSLSKSEPLYIQEVNLLKVQLEEQVDHENSLKSQNYDLTRKIELLENEKDILLESSHNEKNEICKLNEKVSLLETQISQLQDQLQNLPQTSDVEEFDALKLKYNSILISKQNLEMSLSEAHSGIESYKNVQEKLKLQIELSSKEIYSKESEIASYISIINKCKEEEEELKAQIEALKLEQIDPKKRGNSLFSEVDDYRKEVENELLTLQEKYALLEEKYSFTLNQMNTLKHQMIMLFSMTQRKIDSEYLSNLENQIKNYKKQIADLNLALKELQLKQVNHPPLNESSSGSYSNSLLYLSKHELETTKKQYHSLLTQNASLCDELFECKKKLYQAEISKEQFRNAALELKFKLDEIAPPDQNIDHEVSHINILDKESIKNYALKKAQQSKTKEVINIEYMKEFFEKKKEMEAKNASSNENKFCFNKTLHEHFYEINKQIPKDAAKNLGEKDKLGEEKENASPKDENHETWSHEAIPFLNKERSSTSNKKCVTIDDSSLMINKENSYKNDQSSASERKRKGGRKVTAPNDVLTSADYCTHQ